MSPRVGLEKKVILKAAADIANTDGIDSLTITTLAVKLNIKPPSLYNHVKNLHDLRKQLAVYGLEQLYFTLNESIEGLKGDKAVKALAWAYVTFVRTHPGLYSISLSAPDPEDKTLYEAGERVVTLALEALEPFEFEKEEALHVVRGLRSILHGFASLEQNGGFGLNLSTDESMSLLLDAYLLGIHTKQNHC
ncbi:TetR/AcrR family transcriptional regulator [Halalkalibacter alkalisediminis]|uniref:TetR/AcrR family transcriptional regulator n=1 Tax=Halalkalibacter alkalisediminis TaxID=935616 RepID=A0ABV6NIN6_9BACI|nr:TetR/AcrR family transcriptional regulator [Halalkalibacter alkalisediminis]